MDLVNQALHMVGTWLALLIGLFLGVFTVIESFFRTLMLHAGVPENLQQVVLVVVAVLLIIAILRVFGGVLRLLLIVFLVLLALHMLAPAIGR